MCSISYLVFSHSLHSHFNRSQIDNCMRTRGASMEAPGPTGRDGRIPTLTGRCGPHSKQPTRLYHTDDKDDDDDDDSMR